MILWLLVYVEFSVVGSVLVLIWISCVWNGLFLCYSSDYISSRMFISEVSYINLCMYGMLVVYSGR